MIVLAADTATARSSLALMNGPELLAEVHVTQGRGHAERLLPAVDALLALTGKTLDQVDLLASGLGPGGFTGLRIGVVTLRSLAYALGKPIRGVSSLEALCSAWIDSRALLVPTIDAQKGEVYAAVFRAESGALVRQGEEAVLPPARLNEELQRLAQEGPVLVFGSGAERYRSHLEPLPSNLSFVPGIRPAASDVARCALRQEASQLPRQPAVPNYVRKSDAELNWNRGSKP